MSDSGDKKSTIRVKRPQTLSLTKTVESGQVRQNVAGRSKTVTVEVRKTRTFTKGEGGRMELKRGALNLNPTDEAAAVVEDENLSNQEREERLRALKQAESKDNSALSSAPLPTRVVRNKAKSDEVVEAPTPEAPEEQAPAAKKEEAPAERKPAGRIGQVVSRRGKDVVTAPKREIPVAEEPSAKADTRRGADAGHHRRGPATDDSEEPRKRMKGKLTANKRMEEKRFNKSAVLHSTDFEGGERQRSLASVRRAREKARKHDDAGNSGEKIVRDVVIPETITVQELANRMAERAVDVVKSLMKLGTMVTVNQAIDADTAELIVDEFGHRHTRVTEGDVENVLKQEFDDAPETLKSRAPIVTIMGHVDHGKTSLLDALRRTDVAAGEAGGITQHIGAYQVQLESGAKISFFDTPGHAAFTAMRARGAKVTDVVVLVVAADDGIMDQTKEAISHAKAADVPIIVAINKIDKPEADPARVKNELMQHELVPEDFGGDVQCIEVSAKEGTGLDKLEEAILLQAEILDLKANPEARASGAVVEAKLEQGRGVVATLLVQRGTLKKGDIVVAGGSYGRVRAMLDDKQRQQEEAGPAVPVEIMGLNDAPEAGDEFHVVESEKTARDITEYRHKRTRDTISLANARTLDTMFGATEKPKELLLLVKGDVHGSIEAIIGSMQKLSTDEVAVKVVHSGVGMISESDVILAKAVGGFIIGFNVRANTSARDMAARDGVSIRYYSVIYDLVDDVKAALSGMLSPELREKLLGYVEIRQVFNITKVGKVAGAYVTEGMVKRGAKVRLLRDNIVIHDGALKTLKRFKDEVKEVQQGYECGIAFENYEDIREGDMVEAYEVESIQRSL